MRSSGHWSGAHPAIVKLRALIERVAPTEVTVLITGESGTGKEVVAQAIHTLSPRRLQPFVPVNCAAIPHDLLESEMFGHERGAFTGAAGSRHGLLATANRGTIFLDEIGEMPNGLQAKLLRVLEDGVVRPVGADRATRVNVRVIAASNVDLAEAVAKGAFREDLFYRLQVVPIVIAPLRERRSDIPLLTEHFLERIRSSHARARNRNQPGGDGGAMVVRLAGQRARAREYGRAAGDPVRGLDYRHVDSAGEPGGGAPACDGADCGQAERRRGEPEQLGTGIGR